ncbi:MAG: helix-turn-helix transcriptional regulator [Pseudomonadota bacterium]
MISANFFRIPDFPVAKTRRSAFDQRYNLETVRKVSSNSNTIPARAIPDGATQEVGLKAMTKQEKPVLHEIEFGSSDSDSSDQAQAEMVPQFSGMTFGRVRYPAGEFGGQAAPVWHIGVVQSPFKNKICCISGTITRERVVSSGEILVIQPDSGFLGRHISKTGIDFLVLTQDRMAAALHAQHQHLEYNPQSCETYFHSPVVSTLVTRMINGVERSAGFDPYHADNFVNAIVSELFLSLTSLPNEHAQDRLGLSVAQLKTIDEMIDASTIIPSTNSNLASALNMSESTFARAFKKTTGETPYQYVLRRRVDRAQSMIANTDLSIAQISHSCGFSSQSHFTDVFRAKVGLPPGALRRSIRGNR